MRNSFISIVRRNTKSRKRQHNRWQTCAAFIFVYLEATQNLHWDISRILSNRWLIYYRLACVKGTACNHSVTLHWRQCTSDLLLSIYISLLVSNSRKCDDVSQRCEWAEQSSIHTEKREGRGERGEGKQRRKRESDREGRGKTAEKEREWQWEKGKEKDVKWKGTKDFAMKILCTVQLVDLHRPVKSCVFSLACEKEEETTLLKMVSGGYTFIQLHFTT